MRKKTDEHINLDDVVVLRVMCDQRRTCPCDDGDGQWQLYSFNRRHTRFKHPADFDMEELAPMFEAGLAFRLGYFEHGLCRWTFSGEQPDDRWDAVPFAGLLIWEEAEDNLGPKDYEGRKADARHFLEQYTHWCNGEVYEFQTSEEADDEYAGWHGPLYGTDDLTAAVDAELNGRPYFLCGDAAQYVDRSGIRAPEARDRRRGERRKSVQ